VADEEDEVVQVSIHMFGNAPTTLNRHLQSVHIYDQAADVGPDGLSALDMALCVTILRSSKHAFAAELADKLSVHFGLSRPAVSPTAGLSPAPEAHGSRPVEPGSFFPDGGAA